jgi:hypothetical protein
MIAFLPARSALINGDPRRPDVFLRRVAVFDQSPESIRDGSPAKFASSRIGGQRGSAARG